MTTTSQITYCAAHARTDDLIRAAAATRTPMPRSPRSTRRGIFGIARRSAAPAPAHIAPCHS
jgi:hypothetical protein